MADPVSILGTAGALVNIIQIVGQTIAAIRDLQSDWNDADLTFLGLTGHLSALRLALTKIEEWMRVDTGDAHHQLVMDLGDSINCCQVLLTKLHYVVQSLNQKQNKALDFQSKIKLVLGRNNIDDVQKLLEHQTNALTLLLTACNCQTGVEQKMLLEQSSSRKVFRQVNLDSASMMVHHDTNSIATQITDRLSNLSLAFSFDREIFTTKVYERFFRGLTKGVLRNQQPHDAPVAQKTSNDDEWQVYQETMLLVGSDDRAMDTVLHSILNPHGGQNTNVDLKLQRIAVYKFIILSAQGIIHILKLASVSLGFDSGAAHCELLLGYVDDLSPANPLDERVGKAIRSLWNDPCIERVRHSPRDFSIPESALYLFDEIDRIASPNYDPTSRDVQAVVERLPTVIKLKGTYRGHRDTWKKAKPKFTLLDVQLLDVTLHFGSNRPYNIDDITRMPLLVDFTSYYEVLQKEPLGTPFLNLKSRVEAMLPFSCLPWDKKVLVISYKLDEFESKLAAYSAEYIVRYADEN